MWLKIIFNAIGSSARSAWQFLAASPVLQRVITCLVVIFLIYLTVRQSKRISTLETTVATQDKELVELRAANSRLHNERQQAFTYADSINKTNDTLRIKNKLAVDALSPAAAAALNRKLLAELGL